MFLLSCSGTSKKAKEDVIARTERTRQSQEQEKIERDYRASHVMTEELGSGIDSISEVDSLLILGVGRSPYGKREKLYISRFSDGIYVAEEPCNDCERIEKRLTFSDSNTFNMTIEYVGSNKPNIENYGGKVKFFSKSSNVELIFEDQASNTSKTYGSDGDRLFPLRGGGSVFRKAFTNQLTDSLWYLCSLEGKKVPVVHVDGLSSEYIKFENDGHVKAQTKCGFYNAEFDIEDRNLVSVSNLNESKIPCNQDETSTMFIRLFLNDFRYEIESDTLYFRDMNSEIIAKFARH